MGAGAAVHAAHTCYDLTVAGGITHVFLVAFVSHHCLPTRLANRHSGLSHQLAQMVLAEIVLDHVERAAGGPGPQVRRARGRKLAGDYERGHLREPRPHRVGECCAQMRGIFFELPRLYQRERREPRGGRLLREGEMGPSKASIRPIVLWRRAPSLCSARTVIILVQGRGDHIVRHKCTLKSSSER